MAPFCHSSPRDRLQKVARPLSTVWRTASALAHATISTSPVAACWQTHGDEALRVEADLRDQRIGSPRLRHVSFTSWTV